MALIKCPECGKENVSDTAAACPNCGYDIRKYIYLKKSKQANLYRQKMQETPEYKALQERKNNILQQLSSLPTIRAKAPRNGVVINCLGIVISILLGIIIGVSSGSIIAFVISWLAFTFATVFLSEKYERIPKNNQKFEENEETKRRLLLEEKEIEDKMRDLTSLKE